MICRRFQPKLVAVLPVASPMLESTVSPSRGWSSLGHGPGTMKPEFSISPVRKAVPRRPVGSAAAVASSIREKLSRRTAPPAGLAPPPGRSGERRGPAPRRPASPSSSPSSSDAENQSQPGHPGGWAPNPLHPCGREASEGSHHLTPNACDIAQIVGFQNFLAVSRFLQKKIPAANRC